MIQLGKLGGYDIHRGYIGIYIGNIYKCRRRPIDHFLPNYSKYYAILYILNSYILLHFFSFQGLVHVQVTTYIHIYHFCVYVLIEFFLFSYIIIM